MPVLGITSLCPWERHLTLLSYRVFCVVWKDSTGVCFTRAYTAEKKLKNQIKNKRTWFCRYLRKWVWATIALCLTSDVLPRVRRINRTNKQTQLKTSPSNKKLFIPKITLLFAESRFNRSKTYAKNSHTKILLFQPTSITNLTSRPENWNN